MPTTPSDHVRSENQADDAISLPLDEFEVDVPRMIRVSGERLCVVRTGTGVYALENACPHEAYGLTQGSVVDDVITCAWHNWKFDLKDGRCVLGEEDVGTHDVSVVDQTVTIRLNRPDPESQREALRSSLSSAVAAARNGQITRDIIRLLDAGERPEAIMGLAVGYGAPRAEDGWSHEIACATDCLAIALEHERSDRSFAALALITGVSLIASEVRDRPVRSAEVGEPVFAFPSDVGMLFAESVESESVDRATAAILGAFADGIDLAEIRSWFIGVASAHLLAYGHGAIYVQKAFQLIDMLGTDAAPTILVHLIPTLIYATREDTLPYMGSYRTAIGSLDRSAIMTAQRERGFEHRHPVEAIESFKLSVLGDTDSEPIGSAASLLHAGVSPADLMDAVIDACAERMLRYDARNENDLDDDFGWLDITHGMTYAAAARWAYEAEPGERTLQLCLWAVALAHFTGRHEWHTVVAEPADVPQSAPDESVARQADAVIRRAFDDQVGSDLMVMHAIKCAREASLASARLGSVRPIDAVHRFMNGPRRDRFLAGNVHRSIKQLRRRS